MAAGAEQQIVEFLFQVQNQQFVSQLDKISSKFDSLEEKVSSVLTKSFYLGTKIALKGLSMLFKGITDLLEPYKEHFSLMESFRKEAGLTTTEIAEFSDEVISSSTKYGVALNRVGMMATTIAKGSKAAREEIIQLSARMANLGDVTGLTDETATELSNVYIQKFNVATGSASKYIYGLAEMARQSNVSMEEMSALLASNADALRILPIENATRQLGALEVQMRKAGASTSEIGDVLNELGKTESPLRNLFIVTNDITKTVGYLAEKVDNLREKEREGLISHQAYEYGLRKLADRYNMSSFGLEKLADSHDGLSKSMAAFDEIQKKSNEELEKGMLGRTSSMTRFVKRLKSMGGEVSKYFEMLWGPKSAIWGWLDEGLTKLEDGATWLSTNVWPLVKEGFQSVIDIAQKIWPPIVDSFETSVKWFKESVVPALTKVVDTMAKAYGYVKDIATFVSDLYGGREKALRGPKFVPSTKEEKYTAAKRALETQINLLKSKGLTKEAESIKRRGTEAIEKEFGFTAPNIPPKETVPISEAPTAGEASSEVKMTASATQEMARYLHRMVQQGEDGLRLKNMERIQSSSSPAGPNKTALAAAWVTA